MKKPTTICVAVNRSTEASLALLLLAMLSGCSTIAEKAADITNKACKDMSQVERAAFEARVNDALAATGNTFNGITCAGD